MIILRTNAPAAAPIVACWCYFASICKFPAVLPAGDEKMLIDDAMMMPSSSSSIVGKRLKWGSNLTLFPPSVCDAP